MCITFAVLLRFQTICRPWRSAAARPVQFWLNIAFQSFPSITIASPGAGVFPMRYESAATGLARDLPPVVKVFALTFAMGVVTGSDDFQFGTNGRAT